MRIAEISLDQAKTLDMKFILNCLIQAQDELPGRATWLIPAIDIAKQQVKELESDEGE